MTIHKDNVDIEKSIHNDVRIYREDDCSLCCAVIFVIMTLLSVFCSIIPLVNYYNLEEEICHTSNVEYPTELPTFNNTDNWIECDCGKKCISWTPCIKIYINTSDYLILDNYNDDNYCTFTNYSCPLNENVQYLIQELQETNQLADNYINSSFPCYYNIFSGEYSINNEKNDFIIYLILSITVIMILVLLTLLITRKCEKDNN